MSPRPVTIFFSYSHKDAALRNDLARHLARLERERVIATWSDQEIRAGDEWRVDIDRRLRSARVILLLVSENFLESGYCMNIEMREAMDRYDAGVAKVIPIFLSPCKWRGAPFGELMGLPSPNRPVTKWAHRGQAFATIAKGLRDAIARLPDRPKGGGRTARSSARASVAYARGIVTLKRLVEQGALIGPITSRMSAAADAAIAAFDRALSLEPTGGPWATWEYYHRGVAHYCKKEVNAAIANYSRAIDLNAENAFAFRQRAIAHDEAGDSRRALLDYSRAIKIAPAVAKAYYNRGALYLKLEQRRKAVADFRKALTVGDDPEVERRAKQELAALQ